MKRMSKDRCISLLMPALFIAFGLWMLIEGLQMKTMLGKLPSIVGALTAGLGVIQFIMDYFDPSPANRFANSNVLQVCIGLAGLAIYAFLMKRIGYIIDTIFLSLFVMFQLGYRNWKVAVPVAIGFTLIVFCAFKLLLRVNLPMVFLNF